MAFPGNIYAPPGGSKNVSVKIRAPWTSREILERTEEVAHAIASVYDNTDDIVKHTVDTMKQTEDLSLDSLKHIRKLCEGN